MEVNTFEKRFERFSSHITEFTGTSIVFILALSSVVIWAVSGPFLRFSENWQLLINTSTSIITFLMVFLIQRAQNKDYKAIQIKLNELIASNEKASNRIVSVEELTESEINVLQKFYSNLSATANKDGDITTIYHTPDETITTTVSVKEPTSEKS